MVRKLCIAISDDKQCSISAKRRVKAALAASSLLGAEAASLAAKKRASRKREEKERETHVARYCRRFVTPRITETNSGKNRPTRQPVLSSENTPEFAFASGNAQSTHTTGKVKPPLEYSTLGMLSR